MSQSITTPRPAQRGGTAVPRCPGPIGRAATPKQPSETAIDWSRYLPIGDDEMPA